MDFFMMTNAQEDALISGLPTGAVTARTVTLRKLERWGFVSNGVLTEKGRERAEFTKASREELGRALTNG
jgi:hypothetical protein